jgi:hypothetical protein
MSQPYVEITVFEKDGGSLSKHIERINGKIADDSSASDVPNGSARRARIGVDTFEALAAIQAVAKQGREGHDEHLSRDGHLGARLRPPRPRPHPLPR